MVLGPHGAFITSHAVPCIVNNRQCKFKLKYRFMEKTFLLLLSINWWIPEWPFGKKGLRPWLKENLQRRKHQNTNTLYIKWLNCVGNDQSFVMLLWRYKADRDRNVWQHAVQIERKFSEWRCCVVSDRRRCLYRSANYFDYSTQLLATFRRTHSAGERDSNQDRKKANLETFIPWL